VASVVGLTVVHIFGFEPPQKKDDALVLAEKCGIAFQLTNILRDVREDAANGRIYLPGEDLDRFRVSKDTLERTELTPPLRELLRFEAQRARDYYEQSAPLISLVHAASRPSLRALIAIYRRLLDRIVEENYDVMSQRVRLSTTEKLWILVKSRWLE